MRKEEEKVSFLTRRGVRRWVTSLANMEVVTAAGSGASAATIDEYHLGYKTGMIHRML